MKRKYSKNKSSHIQFFKNGNLFFMVQILIVNIMLIVLVLINIFKNKELHKKHIGFRKVIHLKYDFKTYIFIKVTNKSKKMLVEFI